MLPAAEANVGSAAPEAALQGGKVQGDLFGNVVPTPTAQVQVKVAVKALTDGRVEGAILCVRCNSELDPVLPGVRVVSEAKLLYECPTCSCVDARLRKLLGTWPVDEMRDMKEQDVFDFYQRAAATAGPHGLKTMVKSIL